MSEILKGVEYAPTFVDPIQQLRWRVDVISRNRMILGLPISGESRFKPFPWDNFTIALDKPDDFDVHLRGELTKTPEEDTTCLYAMVCMAKFVETITNVHVATVDELHRAVRTIHIYSPPAFEAVFQRLSNLKDERYKGIADRMQGGVATVYEDVLVRHDRGTAEQRGTEMVGKILAHRIAHEFGHRISHREGDPSRSVIGHMRIGYGDRRLSHGPGSLLRLTEALNELEVLGALYVNTKRVRSRLWDQTPADYFGYQAAVLFMNDTVEVAAQRAGLTYMQVLGVLARGAFFGDRRYLYDFRAVFTPKEREAFDVLERCDFSNEIDASISRVSIRSRMVTDNGRRNFDAFYAGGEVALFAGELVWPAVA